MEIKSVAVIGAGTMGSGIASWFTQQGSVVQLIDTNQNQLKSAKEKIFSSWDKLQKKEKFSEEEIKKFKNNISFTTIENIEKTTSLIIEAIIENLEIKKNLFKELDLKMTKECIFASNTSSISISSLSKDLSLNRKEKFLGLHFFNPAPIMKLVEVIKTDFTSKALLNEIYSWFEEKGKMPALCIDSPGFIVNRVARNFYGESLRLVNKPESQAFLKVDEILKKVGHFKMGPFELMDLIGIDINLEVTKTVWKEMNYEPRFSPHQIQKNLVESGFLGKKTKKGFYQYE